MTGIILVDKPQNFTSFDVCAVIRGTLHTKKIGHGGTLDPMATGVLPVFVGGATKAVSLLPQTGKAYRAGFTLGMTGDTMDIWGTCSEEREVNIPESDMQRALEAFRGEIKQTPPMYSAVRIDGRRLYQLARRGIEVDREPRAVTISRLELLSFDGKRGVIDVECSAGTYIRALIDDIGKALGTGAVMTSLVRTMASGFTLDMCTPLEEIRITPAEQITLLPVEEIFAPYKAVYLDLKQTALYTNGAALDAARIDRDINPELPEGELLRVHAAHREFIGIGKITDGELRSVKRFDIE